MYFQIPNFQILRDGYWFVHVQRRILICTRTKRSNLNYLHNSLWIIFTTRSCLVIYSFCASLLHSLIMWLIVSSLLRYNPLLLFCCVLSIFYFTLRGFIMLFWAALRRYLNFLYYISFSNHVHVLSCEICFLFFLNIHTVIFFPFLFLSYCCQVDFYVACFVSGRFD